MKNSCKNCKKATARKEANTYFCEFLEVGVKEDEESSECPFFKPKDGTMFLKKYEMISDAEITYCFLNPAMLGIGVSIKDDELLLNRVSCVSRDDRVDVVTSVFIEKLAFPYEIRDIYMDSISKHSFDIHVETTDGSNYAFEFSGDFGYLGIGKIAYDSRSNE